ncbi:hypothetical protein T4E_3633 [Trichinella pseudospiralis]|uniref:Uncharacterized protein n=1 Tax=Trichinella pseudospiralis TaxID=6337 RepID=A0A0V0YNW6_TRIPS|nr:hypothetical protein T4E_3633 [Trichinella pseudospiralis]
MLDVTPIILYILTTLKVPVDAESQSTGTKQGAAKPSQNAANTSPLKQKSTKSAAHPQPSLPSQMTTAGTILLDTETLPRSCHSSDLMVEYGSFSRALKLLVIKEQRCSLLGRN